MKKLDDSLADAQKALSEVAAEINDRLTERETKLSKKRKAQTTEPTSEDAENGANEGEQNLDELRDKVSRMTTRMDESMRKMIDGQHSVQDIKASIAATATDARLNASTQASTQAASTQRRRRRGREEGEDGEEGDEEEYQDFEPTDPRGGTQPQKSALETFRAKIDDSKTRYQAHSLTDRYADNNAYRDFKRVVHDARHPTGDVPMSHQNEWFDEGQAPAPGMTTRARNGDEEEDSDDDLAVSRTTISTKCPLTLTEFKKPLTSKKCPHSFEAEAILSLINGSTAHVGGGRSGEKTVQCPVSGCSQSLTKSDLHTDAVLVRQIKRLQRSRELDEEDADDREDGVDGPTLIGDDDTADVDDIVEGRTQIKGEPRSGRPKGRATPLTPMRNGGVVEVDSESEAEEVDEDATQDE